MDLTVQLTRGLATVVDAEIFEATRIYTRRDGRQFEVRAASHKWHALKNRNEFYAYGTFNGTLISLSRLLIQAPANRLVDHFDRNTMNDRLDNLRLCSHSQNMANTMPRPGASQYKGVKRSGTTSRPWESQIHFIRDGRKCCRTLGRYVTEQEAAMAYDRAAAELHGEFARLNFPVEAT